MSSHNEKDFEREAQTVPVIPNDTETEDIYSEGGLRAWMTIFGV